MVNPYEPPNEPDSEPENNGRRSVYNWVPWFALSLVCMWASSRINSVTIFWELLSLVLVGIAMLSGGIAGIQFSNMLKGPDKPDPV